MTFKSGYVNIIGKPNAGKSTLLNALMREKLAIVTPKVQTTRHRILGIINGEDYQMVLSDTPGFIDKPSYKMHESMMKNVKDALEDADVILYLLDVTDPNEDYPYLENLLKDERPLLLLLNKIDKIGQDATFALIEKWKEKIPEERIIPISALNALNLERIIQTSLQFLPEGQPYYPEDQYTDRTERFLVSEVIREKIFTNYRQEIPYSTEVIVTSFKDHEDILRIAAEIIVNRASQKPILIGKGGESLKRIGMQARLELEKMYEKKVFLEIFVKVRENWRENPGFLREFGYEG